jgi:hypothetical protein
MGYGIDRLLGGSHLLNGLGLDSRGLLAQLEGFQDQLEVLEELRDSFQRTCGGLSPNMLASMLQNGGIGAPLMMPPPNAGHCSCPQNYAPPQTFDFGAAPGQSPLSLPAMFQRMQGGMFERFLQTNPFARQQFEMAMGGRIVPDGMNDGRVTVQPFSNGFFPAGGAQNTPFAAAAGMFDQMARASLMGPQGQGPFQGMMLAALANLFGSMLQGQGGAGGPAGSNLPRGPNGGSPFIEWFGPPGNPQAQAQAQGGQGLQQGGQFQPGVAGQTQGQFGLGQNDGSDIAGVLNDPGLTIEDKVTLMIMLIMQKMDKDIEKQAQEINKLQQQQNKQGGGGGGKGGGKGKGGGGGGGSDKSIDVETMKLKRLIDKRSQMFDMLRQIIDKYNQTAKGIIDSMGR